MNNEYTSELTHGSTFSGVGGFELGAHMSGIETLWNCELEEHNRNILKRHFPESQQNSDITKLSGPAPVDIISGGFPCQDISIANVTKQNFIDGKAKGIKGERSGLWYYLWKLTDEHRPKYLIIENSPMLIIRGLDRVISDLAKIGYCIEWQCLRASQFGYNHKRERFYGIAYPEQIRCKNNTSAFRELNKVLLKQPSRQNPISVPVKRFNGFSNYESVRMDDGFSDELDFRRIEMMGNAVIPEIAHYLFECVKLHERLTS